MPQAKRHNSTTQSPFDDPESPFRIACDMDRPLANIRRCASILRLIDDEEMDGMVSDALVLISDILDTATDNLRVHYNKLFRALHPHRERFEREGWPGDQQPPVAGSTEYAQ